MVVPGLKNELERIQRLLPALNLKASGMHTLTEFNATGGMINSS